MRNLGRDLRAFTQHLYEAAAVNQTPGGWFHPVWQRGLLLGPDSCRVLLMSTEWRDIDI
jgi:hypothetical protein